MKIVVLPGVNYKNRPQHQYFLDTLMKNLNCDGEIFRWEDEHNYPDFELPLQDTREFVCGVILDFQQALLHATDIEVPDADIYIGHSAGSILALVQKDKPCVIMASPASLIENIVDDPSYDAGLRYHIQNIMNSYRSNSHRPILNLVNKYDVISYKLNHPNVENYVYSESWYNPATYSPFNAHGSYWKSKKVINKIVEHINELICRN